MGRGGGASVVMGGRQTKKNNHLVRNCRELAIRRGGVRIQREGGCWRGHPEGEGVRVSSPLPRTARRRGLAGELVDRPCASKRGEKFTEEEGWVYELKKGGQEGEALLFVSVC